MGFFPFCPHPDCLLHARAPESRWYYPHGSYWTKTFGTVERFKCFFCGTTFSSQTFSTQYYVKKKVDLAALSERHAASQSGRAIGRALSLSTGTVQNRLDRLARQSLALHAHLRPQADPHEAVCVDGFVSFDGSQFFPNEITFSITASSRFILDLSHASHRRSGSMTRFQRQRASELYPAWKPEPKAVERAFRDVLDSMITERPPSFTAPLVIITDEKPEYDRVLSAHPVFRTQDAAHRIVHHTVNSKLPRTWQNPLFASNYLDRELRKDQANHHRESTCFSRNVANGLSRLACYMVRHNYFKKYLIKGPVADDRTHADVAGIPQALLHTELKHFFSDRAFLTRCRLSVPMMRIWRKTFTTPLKQKPEYLPRYALG
jgi:hypothetical protein